MCEIVTMPGGGTAIVCGGHKKKKPAQCFCGRAATRLCDAPVVREVKGWKFPNATCDRAICAYHAKAVDGKDLCPDHAR